LVAPLRKEPIRTDASPKYGKASATSVTNRFNRSAGYNLQNVITGLEKRRAEIVALALEAVARAQEAMERCDRAENRLEQETNQRMVAEQRLRKLEEDHWRQIQAVKTEGAKTLKAMLAHGEAEARLKDAEGRIKAAENDAKSLSLALARADHKRAEAEATARAAKEKAHKIESLVLGPEAVAKDATKRDLLFGFLIFENKRHEMSGTEQALRKVEKRSSQPKADHKNFRQKPMIFALLVVVACWLLGAVFL